MRRKIENVSPDKNHARVFNHLPPRAANGRGPTGGSFSLSLSLSLNRSDPLRCAVTETCCSAASARAADAAASPGAAAAAVSAQRCSVRAAHFFHFPTLSSVFSTNQLFLFRCQLEFFATPGVFRSSPIFVAVRCFRCRVYVPVFLLGENEVALKLFRLPWVTS